MAISLGKIYNLSYNFLLLFYNPIDFKNMDVMDPLERSSYVILSQGLIYLPLEQLMLWPMGCCLDMVVSFFPCNLPNKLNTPGKQHCCWKASAVARAGLSGGAALSWTIELKVVYLKFLTAWWEGHTGLMGLQAEQLLASPLSHACEQLAFLQARQFLLAPLFLSTGWTRPAKLASP